MRVVLKKGDYVVPLKCTCCLADTGNFERVERTKRISATHIETIAVNLPVCGPCLKHRKVGFGPGLLVALGGVILFAIGLYLESKPGARRDTALYLAGDVFAVLWLASWVLAPIVYLWIRWRWRRSHSPHARAGRAVRIGLTLLDEIKFNFANPDYARAFRVANEANLSNSEKRKNPT